MKRVIGVALLLIASTSLPAQHLPVCVVEGWMDEDDPCGEVPPNPNCGAYLFVGTNQLGQGNIGWCNRDGDGLVDAIAPTMSSALVGWYILSDDMNTATELSTQIGGEATGTGSFCRQIGPDMSSITLTDGVIISSVGGGSASFDFDNSTAKTSGRVVSFADDGTLRLEVSSAGVVNADTNYIRTRTQRTGDFSVAGLTDYLNIGFEKTGKRAAVDLGGFDIMTEMGNVYAVGVGANNETYCKANPTTSQWECDKRFTADAGGAYGDNTYLTGGFFSMAPIMNITSTGTNCATAFQLIGQTNEVRTVVSGADYVKAPECGGAAPEPPSGMPFVVLNTDAADSLNLCPPSGGDMGAGTDTAITITVGQYADCWCYLQDTYDCQVN